MMTVTLTQDLEDAIAETAQKRRMTVEAVILETLREKFLPAAKSLDTEDALGEWEQMMTAAAAQIAAVSDGEHAGLAALEKAKKQ